MKCEKTNKYQHRTKENAFRHAHKLKADKGSLMATYWCKHCGFWHVGHTPVSRIERLFAQIERERP